MSNRYDVVEATNGWVVTANTRMGELRDGKVFVFESADDLAGFLQRNLDLSETIRAAQKELPQ